MISYLVRRILLFIPTLIGATAVIFMLMALSPISIVDVLLPLEATSLPPALAIAVLSGIWAAKNRGKAQDVVTGTVLLALYSIPVMWVGVLMVGYLANVHYFKIFPAEGLHDMRSATMGFF